MSRRRKASETTGSGDDSFLDIIANLVGILVILVVVVSLRVQQTVQVNPIEREQIEVVELPPIKPDPIIVGREELPINVSFATPLPIVEEEPTASDELIRTLASLESRLNTETGTPQIVDRTDELDSLRGEIQHATAEANEAKSFLSTAKETLQQRRASYDSLQRDIGRVVYELEQEVPPETEIISLEHDVRAIARVASGEQIYVELAENYLTVLPIPDLIPKLVADVRRKIRNARAEATYEGRVGPVQGVSLFYNIKRSGSSPIDDLRYGPGQSLDQQLTFTVDITPSAESEPIQQALAANSSFQYELTHGSPGATVTAFVYPDSFGAARLLQESLQRRGIRLAIHPIPHGVPITHSPGGARAMAQ